MNFLSERENEHTQNEKEATLISDADKITDALPENSFPSVLEDGEENQAAVTAEDASSADDEQEEGLEETECTDAEKEPKKAPEKEKSGGIIGFIYDTVELVAISLVLVMLILTVFARHSPVNGSSMYPTILGRSEGSLSETVGQDVLLISDLFYTPKKGDIIVVQTPNIKSSIGESLEHPIVKRIIATENDRVDIDFANWRIVINGEVYEEGLNSVSYVYYDNATLVNGTPSKQMYGFHPEVISAMQNDARCNFSQEGTVFSFTVPEGQVFILGDNRNNSKDSRAIGFIDERWIIGKSLLRVYPFDRFGIVE